MVVVLGLAAGVLLVVPSIVNTRWISRRRNGGDTDAARAEEQRWWGVYLLVAALIYVGFALRGPGMSWMPIELAGVLGYGLLGLLGAWRWPILLSVGWFLHSGWDAVLHADGPEGFVPEWYRWACLSFDLVAASYLGRLARR